MKHNDRLDLIEASVSHMGMMLEKMDLRIKKLEAILTPANIDDEELVNGLDGISKWLLENGSLTLDEIKASIESEKKR